MSAMRSGTSMYRFTAALAPPTPPMSGGAFFNEKIRGLHNNCSCSAALIIENDDPVSTSASVTQTESISACEKN
jgi:hypothetical protein